MTHGYTGDSCLHCTVRYLIALINDLIHVCCKIEMYDELLSTSLVQCKIGGACFPESVFKQLQSDITVCKYLWSALMLVLLDDRIIQFYSGKQYF